MASPATESRLRITIFVPLKHEPAYYQTLNWLINELNTKNLGATESIHDPWPVFTGYYFDEDIVADRIVLVTTDAELKAERGIQDIEEFLQQVKQALHERLPDEDEFWITCQPVTRIVRPTKTEVHATTKGL